MNQAEFFKILTKITGQGNIIPIPIELVKALDGDYHAAAMLTQLIYWSDKTKDGWIYKTYKDWGEELALTEHKVREAKKKFGRIGIVDTKIKRANGSPTLHYKVNIEKLLEWLYKKLSNSDSNLENSQNGICENPRLESVKFQDSITETTTETTNNLYNIAEKNSASGGKLEKENQKEKNPPSNNKPENLSCEDTAAKFGQKSPKTATDDEAP